MANEIVMGELHDLVNEQLMRQAETGKYKQILYSLDKAKSTISSIRSNLESVKSTNYHTSYLSNNNFHKINERNKGPRRIHRRDLISNSLYSMDSSQISASREILDVPRSLLWHSTYNVLDDVTRQADMTVSIDGHLRSKEKISEDRVTEMHSVPILLKQQSTKSTARSNDSITPGLKSPSKKIPSFANQSYHRRTSTASVNSVASNPIPEGADEGSQDRNGRGSPLVMSRQASSKSPLRSESRGTVSSREGYQGSTDRVSSPSVWPRRESTSPDVLARGQRSNAKRLIEQTLKEYDVLAQAGEIKSKSDLSAEVYLAELQSVYEREIQSFESIAIFAETKLREVLEREVEAGLNPTVLKAIVSADLLKKLIKIFGKYVNVLDPIINEILNCIFHNYFWLLRNSQGRCVSMQDLCKAGTYFDQVGNLDNQLKEAGTELRKYTEGRDMKQEIRRFQTLTSAFDAGSKLIRDACFKTWKVYHRRVMGKIKKQRIRRMKEMWYRWRIYNVLDSRELPDDLDCLGIPSGVVGELVKIIEDHNKETESCFESASTETEMRRGDSSLEDQELSKREKEELQRYKERQKQKLAQYSEQNVKINRENQTEWDWYAIIRKQIEDEMAVDEDDGPKEEATQKPTKRKVALPPPVAPVRMAVETAGNLIAQIYEYACVSMKQDHQLNFKLKPLKEFTRELLILRYGVKKIANSNLKSIMTCCGENQDNKRLTTFGDIFGIPTKLNPYRKFSANRCSFFFQCLDLLFPQPAKNITTVFNHKHDFFDRDTAWSAVHTLFEELETKAPDMYKQIAIAFAELPFVTKVENGKNILKANIDDILQVVVRFMSVVVPDEIFLPGEADKDAEDEDVDEGGGQALPMTTREHDADD